MMKPWMITGLIGGAILLVSGCSDQLIYNDWESYLPCTSFDCSPRNIEPILTEKDSQPFRAVRVSLPAHTAYREPGVTYPVHDVNWSRYSGVKFYLRSHTYPARFRISLHAKQAPPWEIALYDLEKPLLIESGDWYEVKQPFTKFFSRRLRLPYPLFSFPNRSVDLGIFVICMIGSNMPETSFDVGPFMVYRDTRRYRFY